MPRLSVDHLEPINPSEADTELARESAGLLASQFADANGAMQLQLTDDAGRNQTVRIPVSAFKVLLEALAQIAEGNAVRLTPRDADLTTREAAELLNVSRQYMVRLLDEGRIPYYGVGTQRLIPLGDLMAYRAEHHRQRAVALKELTRLSEELRLY